MGTVSKYIFVYLGGGGGGNGVLSSSDFYFHINEIENFDEHLIFWYTIHST